MKREDIVKALWASDPRVKKHARECGDIVDDLELLFENDNEDEAVIQAAFLGTMKEGPR